MTTLFSKDSAATRGLPTILAVTLCLASPFSYAVAATYCVAMNGNDSHPGTEAEPWKTLHKAAASVKPGDTVRIRAGVYTARRSGQDVWSVTKAGTEERPIIYQAYGDGEVRISGSAALPASGWKRYKGTVYQTEADSKVLAVFQNGLPLLGSWGEYVIRSADALFPGSFYKSGNTLYVCLEDGSDPQPSQMLIATSHVITLYDCHHTVFDGLTVEFGYIGFKEQTASHDVTIRNCVLRSLYMQGIQPIPTNCIIERNLLQKIGADKHQHGMYGASAGTVVRYNVFEEIVGACVHQFGKSQGGKDTEIYGNVFRKPRKYTTSAGSSYYSDIVLSTRENNLVHSNVFYGEGKRSGIALKANNRIFNNTFVACATPIGFSEGKTGNQILNNIFVDAGRSFVNWPAGASAQTLDYNLYFSTSGTPRWMCSGARYQSFSDYQKASGEPHSCYLNPDLVGLADARLRAGSPAIDAGVAVTEVVTDLTAAPRPKGKEPTLGAYEFAAR